MYDSCFISPAYNLLIPRPLSMGGRVMAKLSICNGVYLPGICSFYSVLLFPLIDNQPFPTALRCPCIFFFLG